MQKELISVIVPVYNVKEYLNECIESIVNQTYKELELILVDDGSTDGSSEVCDEWGKRDSRIRIIHKKNGGLSDARNKGIDNATGKYIAFVDGDDYVHSNYLEILLNNLLENDADISMCNFLRVDKEWKEHPQELVNENEVFLYKENEILDQIYENNSVTVVAWNKLYVKTLFDTVKYPKGHVHEDEYVIHQLLYQCKRMVYTSCKLYYYVQRRESITGKLSLKRVEDVVKAFEQRALFFRNVEEPVYENKAWQMWFWIIQRYEECAKEECEEGKIAKQTYKGIRNHLKKELKASMYDTRWNSLNRRDNVYLKSWIINTDFAKNLKRINGIRMKQKEIIIRTIKSIIRMEK